MVYFRSEQLSPHLRTDTKGNDCAVEGDGDRDTFLVHAMQSGFPHVSSQNKQASQLMTSEGGPCSNDSRDVFKVVDNELDEISCFNKPLRSVFTVLWVFTAIIALDCAKDSFRFAFVCMPTAHVESVL
jgi:hypothetical protein